MKTIHYTILLFLMGTFCYSQDIISKKNGSDLKVKIIEVGTLNIVYKELDNLEGPTHSLEKSEIYKITYNNGKTELLGKYQHADEAKSFIVGKINEFGLDRDKDNVRLNAEFDGNYIKINSTNKKKRSINDAELWDLSRVVEFHNVSIRKNNIVYLNIVTYKTKNNKAELDKLVIKMTDYDAAINVLDAMKDLKIMLKED